MRSFTAAALAGATFMAAPAFAQDQAAYPTDTTTTTTAAPMAETTADAPFAGIYAGGSFGFAAQPNDNGSRILFDRNLDGRFGDTVTTGAGANAFSPGFCNGRATGNLSPAVGGRGCRKDKDGSRNSSTSSLVLPPDDANGGIRASIDGAIGKLRDRRRKSSDAERRGSVDSISNSRLSKLPLGRRSRRKSSTKDDVLAAPSTDELEPGRGASPSPSELSLGLADSGRSSLMTEDSDTEQ